MPIFDQTHITSFFNKVRDFERTYWDNKRTTATNNFSAFQQRYHRFQDHIQDIRQQESPYYNIFEVLNIRHRETKVHTPFLFHLLQPHASHEQGALFVNLFFNDVLGVPHTFNEIVDYKIHQEYHSPAYGQIDLFIEYICEGKNYGMVIENKIYAGDQHQQLERYYRFLSTKRKLHDERLKVIYLTVNQRTPTPYSINPELLHSLMESGSFLNITYKEDIMSWLMKCKKNVVSDQVQYIIQQYLQTIAYL